MNWYINVRTKFVVCLVIASTWMFFSIWLSYDWILDLGGQIGMALAIFLIGFLAIIPGFINAFVISAVLLDKRPRFRKLTGYPPVSVLVPSFNEEKSIAETLQSIVHQKYPGEIQIITINDGSTDKTKQVIDELALQYKNIKPIHLQHNVGKANSLNEGLQYCTADIVISVDADSIVHPDGIRHLVSRYLSDPSNTRAVAGTILIRNSRDNWITRAQEWDYFLGIAAIKKIQSLFQGTLVAQGAFSLYDRAILNKLGGWPNTVGEDIVLTWRILNAGFRVGYCENAFVFTNCPNSIKQFVRQRLRWSRGLIEAFKLNPSLLFKPRLTVIFIWWNALFPLIDLTFTFAFIPGVILALFGNFSVVGPMTLALIPLSLFLNYSMLHAERAVFREANIKIRKNIGGMLLYMFAYGFVLQPACVWGYIAELLNLRKSWGTK